MNKSDEGHKKAPNPERSQVIRLGKGQAAKLEKLAEKFQISQSQLVRWAVDAMERKIEAMGGKMTLPFELDETPSPSVHDKDSQSGGKKLK